MTDNERLFGPLRRRMLEVDASLCRCARYGSPHLHAEPLAGSARMEPCYHCGAAVVWSLGGGGWVCTGCAPEDARLVACADVDRLAASLSTPAWTVTITGIS
jgi:hypothetical protein